MSKPLIYYLSDQVPANVGRPSGGMRKIYRHVDVLNAHGFDAYVLQKFANSRCTWFENDTRMRSYEEEPDLPLPDFMVIPEVLGPRLPVDAPDMKTVVFNQNCYLSFNRYPDDPRDLTTIYRHPNVVATMVVSEDSRQYLAHAFPGLRIERVHSSIDPALFFPGEKRRQIAYMPRRRREEIAQVLNMLKFRGALQGFDVVPIEGVNEAEAARILRESMVYLSSGYPEGWGLPPMEAMACGCVTVGYHGMGGREFFLPEFSFPIEIYDIVGYARAVEDVLQRCRSDPGAMQAMGKRASEHILGTYTPEREARDILGIWERLAAAR